MESSACVRVYRFLHLIAWFDSAKVFELKHLKNVESIDLFHSAMFCDCWSCKELFSHPVLSQAFRCASRGANTHLISSANRDKEIRYLSTSNRPCQLKQRNAKVHDRHFHYDIWHDESQSVAVCRQADATNAGSTLHHY